MTKNETISRFFSRAAMLLLVMMLTMTAQTAWAQSTETLGGYTFTIGTDGDGQYYKVDCEAALRALSSYSTSNNCSGKRFVQTADITLTGTFAPIGGNSNSNYDCFKGTYDGGGHTISGLQVEVTSSNFSSASAGLFSEVNENGVVRNVGLIAPSVSCSCSGKGCRAGAIAGYVEYGTITNCFVLNPGTIMASNGSKNYTGLFIGDKSGGTYANLYYYGTTALPMCGGKYALGSNHIERIYKVTAGSNAGLPTRAATEGFIAQGSHYYREGATVQLSYTGSNPNSYRPVYSVSPTNTGASVTEQGVLTMGNGDITITATLSNIPIINISTGTIADIADQAYTGSAIVPDITLTVGGKVLTAGSDYLVSCTNNVNVGTATLTATGQGNYTGTLTKNFRIYYADMTGSCGTNVTYTLHDENQNGHYEQLIISGTGAMTDFASSDDVPWAAYRNDITSVIVQSGVTHIGAFAFTLCWYLTSVSLSEGLTSIGNIAFKSCICLSALTVPASVESVGLNSFENLATSVSGGTLTFASGSRLTSVGASAFYYAHASVDMSACTRLTAVPVAFQWFDKDVTFPHSLTSIAANCFYGNNSKDAKVYVHVPDNYALTVNDETIPATNGKADITSAIRVGTYHDAVTLSCTPDPAHFSQVGNTYTIHTATGWSVFCDLLAENYKGYFSGKTVKLGADITVSRMAGSSYHDFTGTFDGDGHTLTVNYANTGNNTMTAPFSYVDGAMIQNLIVGGTISGTAYRAAGIIGETGNTTSHSHITNCVSNVDISSGRYTGGFSIGGNVEIEGCVFNGKINGTDRSGGFIGYSNSAQVIKNSLFAPQDGSSISGGTFYYNGGGDVAPVNSYYTQALGTAQGKACHSVTAGENVTIDAIALTGDATEYTVSGITAYSGGGLKHGDVKYYGSGDQVSLTLSNSSGDAPDGYQYGGYTASAGTLSGTENPYTLTMPDQDVTITATLQKLMTNNDITVTIEPQTWTGNELTPDIIVKDGVTELIENTDYTVTPPSGTIKDAGDYTYTITGMGSYTGETTATFTITASISVEYTITDVSGTDTRGKLDFYSDPTCSTAIAAAAEGATVYIKVTTNGDYQLSSITAQCAAPCDGADSRRSEQLPVVVTVDVETVDAENGIYQLTMPNCNVEVKATWEHVPVILAIGNGGWATYYHEDGVTYSVSGGTAYYVSSIGEGVANLKAIDGVPTGLPVLISGTAGQSVTLTETASAITVSGNDTQFKGTPTALSATDFTDFADRRTYVLYGGKFLLVEQNSGIGAHKCWLTLSGSNARQLNISIGETTGITPTPNPSRAGGEWYTLDGRKLGSEPTRKGLYIYKGKKVKK